MLRVYTFLLVILISLQATSQQTIEMIDSIDLDKVEANTIKKYWLKMIDNGMAQPVCVPIIIAKGKTQTPVLGLTAAIHGNELNGIRVIQEVIENIDINTFSGTIIAIPGLNAISIPQHRRRYIDEEDLNRHFPGKATGNRTQQYVWQINQKILTKVDYLVDMHTASFGRENTLYVRGDLKDKNIEKMAMLQDADIILKNKGIPSANEQTATTRTMRAEAMLKGVPTITVEYGNPQVYQPEIIKRGIRGIENIMSWLRMINKPIQKTEKAVVCKKSYWVYVEKGGYLEVTVDLKQQIKKGELIGILRNPFGDVLKNYYAPEDGIVIGKSSNPVNMSGGRIIHLGIVDK